MAKKYRLEGNINIQEDNSSQTNNNNKNISYEKTTNEKFKVKTYCGLLLIPYVICFGLFLYFCYKNELLKENFDLNIFFVIFSIFTIILYSVVFISINHKNKLCIISKILEDTNIEKLSDTQTDFFNESNNIKSITSSDQKAKVLIAAIEAIKDL